MLRWPEWLPSETPYSYRKEKETHKLIFSWLSLLIAALLWMRMHDRDDDGDRVVQHGGHTPNNRLTETCSLIWFAVYLFHWYWTSMLWLIDTCQNKVSADQYHMIIIIIIIIINNSNKNNIYKGYHQLTLSYHRLKSTTHQGHMVFEVDCWPSTGFQLECGLMSG